MSTCGMNSEDYSKRFQFFTGDIPPLLHDLLDRADWDSCLDLGCGDGALLNSLDKAGYLDGKSVYAVDNSQSRLDLVQQIDPNFVCLQQDVCETQLQDAKIDFLISTQVIEHVQDDVGMVEEMYRILAPKGTVYLSTVFKKWYGWYFYRCNGKWTLDPTHLREYTRDEQLTDIFERYGLEVLENQKSLDGRALLDAVLRRTRVSRNVYDNKLLKSLRSFTIPIPGYYIWEFALKKK